MVSLTLISGRWWCRRPADFREYAHPWWGWGEYCRYEQDRAGEASAARHYAARGDLCQCFEHGGDWAVPDDSTGAGGYGRAAGDAGMDIGRCDFLVWWASVGGSGTRLASGPTRNMAPLWFSCRLHGAQRFAAFCKNF